MDRHRQPSARGESSIRPARAPLFPLRAGALTAAGCCWVLRAFPVALARAPGPIHRSSEGRTTNTRPALTNTALITSTAAHSRSAERAQSRASLPPTLRRERTHPQRDAALPSLPSLSLASCSCEAANAPALPPSPPARPTPACLPDPRRQHDRPPHQRTLADGKPMRALAIATGRVHCVIAAQVCVSLGPRTAESARQLRIHNHTLHAAGASGRRLQSSCGRSALCRRAPFA